VDAADGRFDFEDVVGGFDHQEINPTFDEPSRLLAEDVNKLVIGDIGHFRVVGGNEFSGGANRAGNEARFGR